MTNELVPINLSPALRQIFTQETPREAIRTRPGRGGRVLLYTDGAYVVRTLNEAFNWNWDFEVDHEEILYVIDRPFEVRCRGKLIIRIGDVTITKMQYGCQPVELLKDGSAPVSLGDAFKGAATDALKKCASLLGIALDLYDSDSDINTANPQQIQQEIKQAKAKPTTTTAATKPHWATIPEDREKAVTILNDRGIPLWALFDRYGVKSFDELDAKPLTDVGKDVLNNTINYWTKANEAQKFFLMIQDITKGYYNHPNHLWQVVGKFDPANKDAQWSAATDHATKSRAEKAAGKAATDQERAEQAIKEIEAITEEMPF